MINKTTFLLFFAIISATTVFAQKTNKKIFTKNLLDYDDKVLHYGICVGGRAISYNREYSSYFNTNKDTTLAISPGWGPGVNFVALVSLRLTNHWDLRFSPGVCIFQRSFDYQFKGGKKETQIKETSVLEFPLLFKYKSMRRGNVRMYMVGGLKPSIELGANKKTGDVNLLKTNNLDLSVEYGFGFDLYYTYFKFSPEIRFSHGFQNLLVNDNSTYSNSLKRITSHAVTLYLYFE